MKELEENDKKEAQIKIPTGEELKRKIETWGHTNEFDLNLWYNTKWLKWNEYENNTALHPIQPNSWFKAIKYDGILPSILLK